MENPVRNQAPRIAPGTFMRGFMGGASSGALMMGIFSTLYAAAALIPGSPVQFHLIASAITIGLGTLSTGIFSGINATQRAHREINSARNASAEAAREPVRAPEHNLTAPALSETVERQTQWTQQVGRPSGSRDRISSIIQDRDLSDKDRASAILREREQASVNTSRQQ